MSRTNPKSVTVPAWVLNELLQMAQPRARELGRNLKDCDVTKPEQIPAEVVAVSAAICALQGKDISRPADQT